MYLSIGTLENCSHSLLYRKIKKVRLYIIIIPKILKSVRIFCIFFDLCCKDRYKTNFLLSNNAQKFILQSRSSKIGERLKARNKKSHPNGWLFLYCKDLKDFKVVKDYSSFDQFVESILKYER